MFDTCQPGETLIVGRGTFRREWEYSLVTLHHMTKTLLVIQYDNGLQTRFRRDGRPFEDIRRFNYPTRLFEATPELLHKALVQKVVNALNAQQFEEVPEKIVLQVYDLVFSKKEEDVKPVQS